MSFFGKQYQRVKAEGVDELMEALKTGEKLRSFLKNSNSKTSYLKNDDGTYSFSMENPERSIKMDFKLDEESELTRPDDVVMKSTYHLDGNTLSQTLKTPDGHVMKFLRVFEGDTAVLTITVEGLPLKAVVHYKTV